MLISWSFVSMNCDYGCVVSLHVFLTNSSEKMPLYTIKAFYGFLKKLMRQYKKMT